MAWWATTHTTLPLALDLDDDRLQPLDHVQVALAAGVPGGPAPPSPSPPALPRGLPHPRPPADGPESSRGRKPSEDVPAPRASRPLTARIQAAVAGWRTRGRLLSGGGGGRTCSPACRPCGRRTPPAWSARSWRTSCRRTCPPGSRPAPAPDHPRRSPGLPAGEAHIRSLRPPPPPALPPQPHTALPCGPAGTTHPHELRHGAVTQAATWSATW